MDWSQLIGPLVKLGLPSLGTAFGGPLGGMLGQSVANALGTEPTPQAVQQAIATTDPETIKAKLADLESARQADIEALRLHFADVANARGQTVQLAQTGSPIAYGAPLVSGIVLGSFAAIIIMVMYRGIPSGNEQVMIGLVEALKAMAIAVVSYWVGSSISSKRNADAVREIAVKANTPSPAQIAGEAIGAAVGRAVRR